MTVGGNDSSVFVQQHRALRRARGDHPGHRQLRAVTRRAPNGRVAILGYPWILPERVGCFDRVSDGHDACQPIGTRWVEPVTQGTNAVVVHPNALGERRMAQRAIRVLDLG